MLRGKNACIRDLKRTIKPSQSLDKAILKSRWDHPILFPFFFSFFFSSNSSSHAQTLLRF